MKRWFLLFPSLALFIVVVFFTGYEREPSPKLRLADSSKMEGITITHKKNGDLKWTLQAKSAVFVNEREVKLSGITVGLPAKGMTLTSDLGTYFMDEKDLVIDGSVRASTDAYEILAGSLQWDADKNEIHSDRKVTIVGKTFTVEGEGLVATTDRATLNRNVRVVFHD
jgi:LPS export ABC transporter protein LptC